MASCKTPSLKDFCSSESTQECFLAWIIRFTGASHYSEFCTEAGMNVPGVGLEPTQPQWPTDFESVASTSSATRAIISASTAPGLHGSYPAA